MEWMKKGALSMVVWLTATTSSASAARTKGAAAEVASSCNNLLLSMDAPGLSK
jgi:hypothetical protein